MSTPVSIDTPPASKPPAPAFKVLSESRDTNLDNKRRLTVPADWRAQMGNPTHVMVMKDIKIKKLTILTPDTTEEYYQKISGKTFEPLTNELTRFIGQNSETLPFDHQGRIRISEKLLARVGIKNAVTLIGCGNRIEIYAPENVPSDDPSDDPAEQERLALAMQKMWGGGA